MDSTASPDSVAMLSVTIGSLASRLESEDVPVPITATVDDLIKQLALWIAWHGDCCGFIATAQNADREDDLFDDSDDHAEPVASDLAENLAANGGVLLERGKSLAWYGIDGATCSEVKLFPVYASDENQPSVSEDDMQNRGFGENVYKYVKLIKEDEDRLVLNIGSLKSEDESRCLTVPATATVDDLITYLPSSQGCSGFLVAAKQVDRDDYEDYFDDETPQPVSSGLAEKLSANGGVLLEPGQALSCYGIDSASCSEITIFPVYSDGQKQPTVFKKDMQDRGFGENVYKYVILNKEDKELVAARDYFRAPLFPWLQSDSGVGAESKKPLKQTIAFSMEDNFTFDEPRAVLTVAILPEGEDLHISCSNLAGDPVCSVKLAGCDIVAALASCLCDELQWSSVTLYDESEHVSESCQVSKYSLLTAEQTFSADQVSGCYQCHKFNCHPAGYSASSTSMADTIVLETGKAGLKRYFAGDYKRACELQSLVMADARWTIAQLGEGEGDQVVRVTGKATLSRHWEHERSGLEGVQMNNYECYASVTIPLHQLERAQQEEHRLKTQPGTGWTCGSEDYKASFFLPMPMLNALRVKPEKNEDTFVLQRFLNKDVSPDYPHNELSSTRRCRWGAKRTLKLDSATLDLIKYFRQGVAGKPGMGMDELLELQACAPQGQTVGESE